MLCACDMYIVHIEIIRTRLPQKHTLAGAVCTQYTTRTQQHLHNLFV